MAGHVIEHCDLPRTWFRRAGSVWACSCGKLYRITYVGAYDSVIKTWEVVEHDKK